MVNPLLEAVQPNGLTVFTYQGVSYSDDASELMDLLYSAGLVVPFDWSTWMSERGNALLESGESIEAVDAVRMITAVTRAERFVEGTFGEQIRNGTLHQLLSVILGEPRGTF